MTKKIAITDVVLRDAHQSLFATRLRLEDMLPIAPKLDQVGYWSLETWGGATFDSCIRFLGEDPWERLRQLKKAMPNTPQQMLLRGQNLLGYRHYADDVVEAFVERAAINGMDVFRIFDAMNDLRNLETAIKATIKNGKHAQGTISYTVSPVHTQQDFVDMAKGLEDMGCHSICIKDMAGLLKPYVAYDLVTKIKAAVDIPLTAHCHATTGMSTATLVKSVEAGIDMIDTSISSMSMTYGHSATESLVAILEDTEHNTGFDLTLLAEIAAYFRTVRQKYAAYEGSLKGIDPRILLAQVPGGMLTNMEGQLKEQNAEDKFDEVLQEIPRVRKDLGYIPLVTPTSQIVGTQAVLNVLSGERYSNITKETAGILKGEYGKTAAPVNQELQAKVLDEGTSAIECRPADLLDNELAALTDELRLKAKDENFDLTDELLDDVMIYAQFPQVGLNFFHNRNNPDAFETLAEKSVETSQKVVETVPLKAEEAYHVVVNGQSYDVTVGPGGDLAHISPATASTVPAARVQAKPTGSQIPAPLAGTIFKINIEKGQIVNSGDVIMVLEAMKMETEVRSPDGGTIIDIHVKEGDAVQTGDPLISIA